MAMAGAAVTNQAKAGEGTTAAVQPWPFRR
jgi:hypothetical protein